jgi:retinol dehydrogenase-12
MACPFELTKDGIESQFAVNYLGHFLFTQILMPAVLKAGKGARVVNLSSCAHLDTPAKGFDFDAIKTGDRKAMSNWERYAISKVAMILFTHGLHKRYGDKGVYTNALHPGFVRTGLMRGSMGYGVVGKVMAAISYGIAYPISIDAHRGALTSLYCATHPDIESKDIRDQYFVPIAKLRTEGLSDVGKDYEVAEKLWTFSEEMLKEKGITN